MPCLFCLPLSRTREPALGLLAQAVCHLRQSRVIAPRHDPHVVTQADHQLNGLNALQNKLDMIDLVFRAVRPINRHHQFDQFIFDLLPQRVFVFSGKIFGRRHDTQQNVVGFL